MWRSASLTTKRIATPTLLAMLSCLVLVGCYGSMDQLDQQVAEMIAQRQQLSLGDEGVSDASVDPPGAPHTMGIYDEQPKTNNPAAASLPAKTAAEEEATPGPESREPGDDVIAFDLPALLAYSIEQAPEYRSEKERLFLATLSLIIERHLWGPRFFNTLSADLSGTPESGDYDTALD
ncbi:MAG: hypothetical protein AAF085_02365, partial [Planctomycetota bacterium]